MKSKISQSAIIAVALTASTSGNRVASTLSSKGSEAPGIHRHFESAARDSSLLVQEKKRQLRSRTLEEVSSWDLFNWIRWELLAASFSVLLSIIAAVFSLYVYQSIRCTFIVSSGFSMHEMQCVVLHDLPGMLINMRNVILLRFRAL